MRNLKIYKEPKKGSKTKILHVFFFILLWGSVSSTLLHSEIESLYDEVETEQKSEMENDSEKAECTNPETSNFLENKQNFTINGPMPNVMRSAIRITFQRYLYGLLNADVDLILSVTADNVDLPYYNKGINKEMQREFFSELFATYEMSKITAEDLYCIRSGKMVFFEGERAMITITARKTPPKPLKNWHYWDDFWNLDHHYFFEKIRGRWRLIAFDIAYEPELI